MLHPRILIGRPVPELPSEALDTSSADSVQAWVEALRASDETSRFERMVAPVEPVARKYLREAGLPFDPGLSHVLKDPQHPGWGWEGTLECLMQYWYGEESAEFCAANILILIFQIRHLLARQGSPENVMILTSQLMITLEYAKNTRLFTPRGRRPGTRHRSSRAEFYATYLEEAPKVQRRRGSHLRDEDIARAMGLSLSTFYRRVQEHGRPILPDTPS